MRIGHLPVGPIYPVFGAGSLWSGSASVRREEHDDRVVRIDPKTLRIVQILHVGGDVPDVAFGFGSVWAAAPGTHTVIRIGVG